MNRISQVEKVLVRSIFQSRLLKIAKLGEKLKVPVYQFLKEPIIRRFGVEIFEALEATAKRNA